ncbi:unnamed protein product [Cunninghamella blakesleeana]
MMVKKQVTFSGDIELIDTFANEDYDRTAQQVAKLSYRDMYELLLLKSQIKQEMLQEQKLHQKQQELLLQQQQQQQDQQDQNLQDHQDRSIENLNISPPNQSHHSPIYISIS